MSFEFTVMMKKMATSVTCKRSITTISHLSHRIKQTEKKIVQMFLLPSPWEAAKKHLESGGDLHSLFRMLDERFIRILKLFKWGPDAKRALEVLKLRVDHQLVREVLAMDVGTDVKVRFFKWAGKKRNFVHDSSTYMALIQCLDEAGSVGDLWRTIQDMTGSLGVIDLNDLSEIIRILGMAKMVNKALSLFYQVKGRKCYPSTGTYNSKILMLMQEGRYEKAHALYNEMCNDSECLPDTATYNVLISVFAKLGRDDSAFRLFDEMKVNGLQPTLKIYTALMAIHFKHCDKVLSLVQEMKWLGFIQS